MKCLVLVLFTTFGWVGIAQDCDVEQTFVGCYVLRIEGRPRIDYGSRFLPKRFELKTEPSVFGFTAKNLDSRVRWDLAFSSWRVRKDGSLDLDWSTGYVGWAIQLSRSGPDDLSGTARFWTDTGSERRGSRVFVHTAKCGDFSNKS